MTAYLVYYITGLLVIFIPSRLKSTLFSLQWFLFVGFRDGIGVDYFSTLKTFERQIIDLENIRLSFTGYNLLDAELAYKILGTAYSFTGVDPHYMLTIIALIESIFINLMIQKSRNKNLMIFVFITMFTLHFPMNAIRQGFCLISLVFANTFFKNTKAMKARIFYGFSFLTHYASIPILIISRLKINAKIILLFSLLIFIIFKFLNLETIFLRYSLDSIDSFTFKGYGIKIYLFTFLFLIFNNFILKKKIDDIGNLYILTLAIVTILFNPMFRLFFFFFYFKIMTGLFSVEFIKLGKLERLVAISIPILLFAFEWQEILRFKPCIDCGSWVPYKSLLF